MSHLQGPLPAVTDRVDPLVDRFLDMREKLKWMMSMGGERVLLYKRKYAGTFCGEYDQVRKQHRNDPTDLTCFGTNYVGGYFGPFEIYVSFAVAGSKQQVQIYEQGLRRTFEPTSWSLWEPALTNKDFIVRRDNKRYWINNVEQTKWRHHTLRQLLQTTEIEANNVIYKIPFPGLPDSTTGVTCTIPL